MTEDPHPDRQAIQSAADKLRRPLSRYAARLVGVDRADDAVQETFLRLWSTASPPQAEHLAQWLFTVCRNVALDIRRKEDRMGPLQESNAQACPDGQPAPPAVAEQREATSAVLAALRALPENQQEVIRLKFQNGFTYRQIAGVTGLSAGNVGFLIHTAIKAVRHKLGADLPAGRA